jgi:two-component system chemotaxis response regulator CheB
VRRIRVLIVDDAATMRRLIAEALSADPGIEISGTAANGKLALERIVALEPDVVILDLEMPVLDGLQTLAELRRTHPRLPVIIFSSLSARGARATLEALTLGANDYVLKASGGSLEASLRHAREQLVPRIRALCARAEARARASARGRRPGPMPAAAAAIHAPVSARREGPHARVEVVAIGTSTGGPVALAEILPALPQDFPVSIVVVQHMPPLFTGHLAERLSARSPLRVREGFPGAELVPGEAWIAPGDHHMVVRRVGAEVRIALHSGPPENSCRPAADELFRSVADAYGPGALAVVLTGMGQDGLRGCARVREAGGVVIAQDAESSTVWGMPGSVVRAGLAEVVLPLSEIAAEITRRVLHGRHGGRAAA